MKQKLRYIWPVLLARGIFSYTSLQSEVSEEVALTWKNRTNVHTNIPHQYRRKDMVDFDFKKQRLPFLLDDNFPINDISDTNDFLEDDDELIRNYLSHSNYPYSCLAIAKTVKLAMEQQGLSAEVIFGGVNPNRQYDESFTFDYLVDFNEPEKTRPHWYVVSKVRKDGVVNEIIFDYSADQFSKGSIVPVVGSRDDLRSIYVNLGNRLPCIEDKL
jgi:hypothetical protein